MITEDYVSFEVAKLLKEKGFDEICRKFYKCWPTNPKLYCCDKSQMFDYCSNSSLSEFNYVGDEMNITAPTHQMAMKWLRNVHGIHIQAWCPVVDIDTNILGVKYNVVISNLKDYCLAFATDIEDNNYDSYEEAVDAGLKYTLEHLL